MNTIPGNFNYLAKPWWNFDFNEPVNFYSTLSIQRYLQQVDNQSILNILKSHHSASFLSPILEYITSQFCIVYIYRDPRDVLVSNWRLIRSFSWDEGPKPDTASEFIRLAPSGAMMRYQQGPEKNMLTRWRTHVEDWLACIEENPALDIHSLRYEDLNLDFEASVESLSEILKQPIQQSGSVRPNRTDNVVGSGAGTVGGFRSHFDDDDLAFIRDEIGPTLSRLGYPV